MRLATCKASGLEDVTTVITGRTNVKSFAFSLRLWCYWHWRHIIRRGWQQWPLTGRLIWFLREPDEGRRLMINICMNYQWLLVSICHDKSRHFQSWISTLLWVPSRPVEPDRNKWDFFCHGLCVATFCSHVYIRPKWNDDKMIQLVREGRDWKWRPVFKTDVLRWQTVVHAVMLRCDPRRHH